MISAVLGNLCLSLRCYIFQGLELCQTTTNVRTRDDDDSPKRVPDDATPHFDMSLDDGRDPDDDDGVGDQSANP